MLAGVTGGMRRAGDGAEHRIGTPTKNSTRPANTPAIVNRNCFIDRLLIPLIRRTLAQRGRGQMQTSAPGNGSEGGGMIGRSSRIRTCDPRLPKTVLYQTELYSDARRGL